MSKNSSIGGDGNEDENILVKLRRGFQHNKEMIQQRQTEFRSIASSEPDQLKRSIADNFALYAELLEDLYTNVDALWVAAAAVKSQLDVIKDIVIQLPGVADNPIKIHDIKAVFEEPSDST